jgi:hypothetical protein
VPLQNFPPAAPPPRKHKSHRHQNHVHFTEATIAREEQKEQQRTRSFAEYWDRYVSRDPKAPVVKKRHREFGRRSRRGDGYVSTLVDPAVLREGERERRHSVSGGSRRGSVVEWPQSCYYLGTETEEPLFLRPKTSRQRRSSRGRHEFVGTHGPLGGDGGYHYTEQRGFPEGRGLRRVKSFFWG